MAAARPRTQRATQQQQAPVAAPPAPEPANDGIARILAGDEVALIKTEVPALEAITRSEVAMQLDSAHRWPRSTKRFLEEATSLATLTPETAQSCFYVLPPREGSKEPLQGPSVRLAEMCASSWGNMHVGARIINIGEREITAQAVAWDLEKNLRLSFEVQRGIMTSGSYGKQPRRYGDAMINVTCMAAISIAYRNAVFRIIPKSLVDHVYQRAKATAVGDKPSLSARRAEWLEYYVTKRGVPADRVYARLGVAGPQDITLEHLAILIGFSTSLKNNETTLEECFPPLPGSTPAPVRSKGAALDVLAEAHAPKPAPQPAPAAQPEAQPALTFTPAQLHAELALADEAWGMVDVSAVAQWSAADQLAAYEWATAWNDPTNTDDDALPPRPACTVLTRQPGEDG